MFLMMYIDTQKRSRVTILIFDIALFEDLQRPDMDTYNIKSVRQNATKNRYDAVQKSFPSKYFFQMKTKETCETLLRIDKSQMSIMLTVMPKLQGTNRHLSSFWKYSSGKKVV